MKTLRCIILGMLMCVICIPGNAQRTLSKMSTIKGVTSIYIGKMMLNMAGSAMGDIGVHQNAVDLGKLTKNLTSIEIVQCDGNSMEKAEKECRKILAAFPFEVITEVSCENEQVEISGVPNKDGNTLNMLLITTIESDELVYILMKGKIDMETLNNAITSE